MQAIATANREVLATMVEISMLNEGGREEGSRYARVSWRLVAAREGGGEIDEISNTKIPITIITSS